MSTDAATDQANPYDDEAAIEQSCYTKWSVEALVQVADGSAAPALADRVHSALRAVILDPEFPCVGARSAVNQGSYRFAMYDELNTPHTTAGLARDLYAFVQEQLQIEGEFTTFIASFDAPKAIQPVEFEELLWGQLRRLHEVDR